MSTSAFALCPCSLPTFLYATTCGSLPIKHRYQTPRPRSRIKMQLPPPSHKEPPPTPDQLGPPGYKWNPDFPGTLKPGTVKDNYPLEDVLSSGVYERMKYEEMDIDDRTPLIFELEEDLLDWLTSQGRLIPRGASDDEFDTEADRQISGITEEDLEFADEDSKMIAYYSRQGEGSSEGASTDFGGFSDSSADLSQGF